MKMFKKLGLATALLCAGTSAQAFTCYIDSNTATVKGYMSSAFEFPERSANAFMDNLDRAVKLTLDQQTAVIRSALETLAQQKQVSTMQVSKAIENNTKIQVTAEQQAAGAREKTKAIQDYGQQGQGFDICNVHESRTKVVRQQSRIKEAVPNMIRTEITARPGLYADRSQQIANRLELHDRLYCTQDQARAGLCTKPAPRAGKSLMAATMFEPAEYNSDNYQDKSAFINNMMGFAADTLTPEEASSEMGQSYQDTKRRLDAVKSTAATYLKNLQAQYSGVADEPTHTSGQPKQDSVAASEARQVEAAKKNDGKDKDGKTASNTTNPEKNDGDKASGGEDNTPLAAQMKKDVDRYFGGGEEYKDWSRYLVGATERGVMKELLAVKALRLKLAADEYEQLLQHEAMIAAMASAQISSSGLETKIDQQRRQALRNTASSLVGR
ncbi:hypothetical protein ACFBZI_11455 [Moraxella sp. ZJ142]|uniref:hypothetical protein n=1 Tax=Moraxella marmotae TaxID=3344520 RepID=UPI0035D3E3E3